MKQLFLLIVVLVFCYPAMGQQDMNSGLAGTWNEKQGSRNNSEELYFVKEGSPAGKTKITLNADSTYKITACLIETGRWHVSGDSLLLEVDGLRYLGMNNKAEAINPHHVAFLIKKNQLVLHHKNIYGTRMKDGSWTKSFKEESLEIF